MDALAIVGVATSAVMWIGLIYVLLVEPVRLYLQGRRLHRAEAVRGFARVYGIRGGQITRERVSFDRADVLKATGLRE